MPPRTNGAVLNALIDDVFSLGDLEEKTKPISIVRDGKPVILPAYFEGDGCPLSILIQVSAARDRYRNARAENFNESLDLFAQEVLRIAIPDLTPMEVELIAGSSEKRTALLQHLDWFSKPAAIADPEDDADPEAGGGVESTTDASSPDSATSTTSPAASSSA